MVNKGPGEESDSGRNKKAGMGPVSEGQPKGASGTVARF